MGADLRALDPGLSLNAAQKLARQIAREGGFASGRPARRVAVLGSFSTQHLGELIRLYCLARGVEIALYAADFGVLHQEILDPASQLNAFQPQVIYLALTHRDLAPQSRVAADASVERERARTEAERWLGLAATAYARFSAPVILDAFAAPPLRALGNHEARQPASFGRHLAAVNAILQQEAPSYVTIHDVDFLASQVGRWNWFDERYYFHAKLPCAPDFLPLYAHSVAALIAALAGRSRKCLVLDLDNTLWGGIVGDDGVAGLRLGPGDAEGEAFQAFQHYVKALAGRGVILAVCSKNDETIAREAFERHPGMVLKPGDIACFVANWRDKLENLSEIAQSLEIGLDAMVFVDDNPAEREMVRRYLPEVAVPELPDDAAGFAVALDRQRYFETTRVVKEDWERTEMYRHNAQRKDLERAAADVDEFLRSLEMRARVEPIGPENLERAAQLIARSNQFNLTTRRRTAAELAALIGDPQFVTCAISLSDRFGDNGLISVIIAQVEPPRLKVDTWLMSCRVLRRGVEALALDRLAQLAAERGMTELTGDYLPTPKNRLVEHHYRDLGFAPSAQGSDGATTWRLELPRARPLPHFIATP